MLNEPIVFKWGVFFIALFVFLLPVLVIYIMAKTNSKDKNEQLLNKVAFFANNLLLYLLSLVLCFIVLLPYYGYTSSTDMNVFYGKLIGTGIILPFVLYLIGVFIRYSYYKLLDIFNTKNVLTDVGEKTVLTVSLIILICAFWLVVDYGKEQEQQKVMFSFFILALVLGRYIWIDTTYKKLHEELVEMWTDYKASIYIGVFVLIIMVVMRYMPIYVKPSTALSFGVGLLVAMIFLIGKAVYDYKKLNNNCS